MLEMIFGKLELAVFKVSVEHEIECVVEPPAWVALFFGDMRAGDKYLIDDEFPFLQNFLFDAEQHWKSNLSSEKNSGPWVEPWPRVANGEVSDDDVRLSRYSEEAALEAKALNVDGERILLLTELGDEFLMRQNQMQMARENLLDQEQLRIEVSKRTAVIRDREAEISCRLIAAAGKRDEETGSHIRRIGLYSEAMARITGLDPFYVDDIRLAAPMHDIGKIAIADNILLKEGRLLEQEYSIMQTHAAIGGEMLRGSGIPMLELAADIAESHHEKFDGTGYPNGLKGEEIPIGARIVAIVDVFDALRHQRVYKEAYSEEKTMKILRECRGSHFDPNLLDTFIANLPLMRQIMSDNPDDFRRQTGLEASA